MATGDFSFRQLAANLGFAPNPVDIERQAAAKREQEEFEASPEGQAQRAYNEALAYERELPYVAPEDRTAEENRLIAKAANEALIARLNQKLNRPISIPRGTTVRASTPTEQRAVEQDMPAIDPTTPRVGTPTGADIAGAVLKERPTLPAEVLYYPIGAAGAAYDIVKQSLDANPNLTQEQRLAATSMAALGFIPGAKGAKAAKGAAEELLEEGTKQAVKGYKKMPTPSGTQAEALATGDVEDIKRTLEELGFPPSEIERRLNPKEGDPVGLEDLTFLENRAERLTRQKFIEERLSDIEGRRAAAQTPEGAQQAAETTAQIDTPTYVSGIMPLQDAPPSRNVRGLSGVDDVAEQGAELQRRAELDVGLAKDPERRAVDIATLELPDAVRQFAQSRRYNLSTEETAGLAQTIRDNGGITYDVGTKTAKETGFSVAPFKDTELKVDPEDFTPDTVRAYAQTMESLLDVDGVHLGVWFDKDNNKYVFDVSVVAPNTDEGRLLAARLAKNGDQDAIFHLDTFDEIDTPDLEAEFGEEILKGATTPEYEALSQVLERVTRRVSPSDTKGLAKQSGLKPQEVEDIRAYHEKMVRSKYKRGEPVSQDILDQYPDIQSPPAPLIALNKAAPEIVADSRASFTVPIVAEDKTLYEILRPDGTPYVKEGQTITNNDIFDFLTDKYEEATGRTTPMPFDETGLVYLQNTLTEELLSQLEDTKAFMSWYTDDVQEFLDIASQVFPELKNSEVHRMTLLNIASYTSNGLNPVENGRFALASYAELTQKGGMSGRNPFTIKDGRLAGYGTRGPTVQQGLLFYSGRIKKLGLDGAARELLELNSKRGIRQMRQESGVFSPTHAGPGHPVPIGALMPNLYGNGPKIGTYGGNLVGMPGGTFDVWQHRQELTRMGYGRLLQKDAEGKKFLNPDVPALVKTPTITQKVSQQMWKNIGKATNLEDFQVQALLWFYEQNMYRRLGKSSVKSGTMSEGARKFVDILPELRFVTPNGYLGDKVTGTKTYPVGVGTEKKRAAMESVRSPRKRAKSGEYEFAKAKAAERKAKAEARAAKKKREAEEAASED